MIAVRRIPSKYPEVEADAQRDPRGHDRATLHFVSGFPWDSGLMGSPLEQMQAVRQDALSIVDDEARAKCVGKIDEAIAALKALRLVPGLAKASGGAKRRAA